MRQALQSVGGATIRFYPEVGVCEACGERLQVYKTQTRSITTLEYGIFQAHETVLFCPRRCAGPTGKRRLYRSQFLAQLVSPRHVYGFDVLAKVGILRFLKCRQRLEIQEEIRKAYGFLIPEGSIDELIERFVDAILALHEQKVPQLRASLEAAGGYILHVDGTCEEGSSVHFACLTGPEPMVLWSDKIESENAIEIRGVLAEIEKRFGKPAASVEDLSAAIRKAVLKQWPGLQIFYCHQHFLRDVGKDLLGKPYILLRAILRQSEIRPQLRRLLKSISNEFGWKMEEARQICQHLDDPGFLNGKDRSLKAAAAAGGVTEWILSASTEGGGQGFPFDLPHLSFCLRASQSLDILDKRIMPNLTGRTPRGEKLLFRLRGFLHVFLKSDDLAGIVAELKEANAVFTRLRNVLRLAADRGRGMNQESCYQNPEDVQKTEQALLNLHGEMYRERNGDSSPHRCKAVKIVLKHLDKFWEGLFGHCLPLAGQEGDRYLMVQRTNNMAEGYFRGVKRFARRISGKKKLRREVDALPGHVLLVFNLKIPQYVKIVCGSLEQLPEVFAKLAQRGNFPRPPEKDFQARILDRNTRRQPDFPTKVTAAFGRV